MFLAALVSLLDRLYSIEPCLGMCNLIILSHLKLLEFHTVFILLSLLLPVVCGWMMSNIRSFDTRCKLRGCWCPHGPRADLCTASPPATLLLTGGGRSRGPSSSSKSSGGGLFGGFGRRSSAAAPAPYVLARLDTARVLWLC